MRFLRGGIGALVLALGCGSSSSSTAVSGPADLSGSSTPVASALARRAFYDFPDLPEMVVQYFSAADQACGANPLLIALAISYQADGGQPLEAVPIVDLRQYTLADGGRQHPPLPFATFAFPEVSGSSLIGTAGTVQILTAASDRLAGQLSVEVALGGDAGTELFTGNFEAPACGTL